MTVRIAAGMLRHQIQILDPNTGGQDTAGGVSSQGTPFGPPTWGFVQSLSGRELNSAQQINSEITHRITMRWQPGIRAKQSVIFGDRYFHIEAVLNYDEQENQLVLLCIERNDSARDPGGTAAALE